MVFQRIWEDLVAVSIEDARAPDSKSSQNKEWVANRSKNITIQSKRREGGNKEDFLEERNSRIVIVYLTFAPVSAGF